MVSFLVLDYKKPEETKKCLLSIKKYVQVPHEIIYLDNGSNDDYVWDFKKDGLADILISRSKNDGCGNSMERLYKNASFQYCFMLQSDQELITPITQPLVDNFISLLNSSFGFIDLAGGQAGHGKYSDRFGFFNRDFYLSIYKGEEGKLGGPGPFNYNKYTEQYIQEYFTSNFIKVYHFPSFVRDNGKWSIREIGDGIYKHRTDTKELTVLKTPTYKTAVYPPLNDEEWNLVLTNQWKNGTIPEEWKNHSFLYWKD